MAKYTNFVALPKTEYHSRLATLSAAPSAGLSAEELGVVIEIDLLLRRRPSGPPFPDLMQLGSQFPKERRYMSHEEFEAAYGADPADVAAVLEFARAFGFAHVRSDLATRIVTLSGSLRAIGKALSLGFTHLEDGLRRYRAHTGPISVPAELQEIVSYVLGTDEFVIAHPMAKQLDPMQLAYLGLTTQIHTPQQVAEVYRFPDATGRNECIGMVEFGGGYTPQVVQAYFAFGGMKVPVVVDVPLAGGANRPGLLNYLDSEVYLDIEIAGAAAPDATLAVYFAPSTGRGFVQAFSTAIHDRVNRPSVVFCTWGFAEARWAAVPHGMDAVDEVLQDAALLGVTVLVASGDFGATAGIYDGLPHLYFPASSPHVLSVGGTTLYTYGELTVAEYTWNRVVTGGGASTGGYSEYFPVPAYQQNKIKPPQQTQLIQPPQFQQVAVRPGRAVPDVAALGDPTTGYLILMDSGYTPTAGTSAATPLWAALIARFNEVMGVRTGYINPLLYASLSTESTFREILSGDNLFYKASPGWNPCTGWGSPDGVRLLGALAGPPPSA